MNLKKKLLTLIVLPLLVQPALFAQEEEDERCMMPEDKKVVKLLKEAESGKNDDRTRSMAFAESVKLAPDNAYVYYAYAVYNFGKADALQKQFDEGRANFNQLETAYKGAATAYKKVIENCSDYHSDAYYKLGYIYYLLGDKAQAAGYFQSFVDFSSKDPDKYSDTYSKNKADVEQILPEMAFFEEFYKNEVPFDPKNVANVSSDKDEYLPIISPDNQLIFYTRRGKSDNPGGVVELVEEKFTMSERKDVNSPFNKGEALRNPFNTGEFLNYGGVSLSLDNKEMFICACESVPPPQKINCDLYRTTFERSGEGGYDFTWTPLENLGPNINTPDGWEAQPTLSPDGNTLYFASWREGSQLTDIYFSKRQKDGSWGRANPVPGPINSAGHDKGPFIHQDSETMYFVSDCTPDRPGAGGSDMFYSRMKEDGSWDEPKNIGYPINTSGNEVGMVVSTDGHLAYFASRNANSKGFDIFYFELYEEARPQKVKFISGVVKDEAGEPIKDAVVEVSYKDSEENVEIKVNGDDGKFAAIVNVDEEKPEDVMVTIKKKGHSFDTKLYKAEDLADETAVYEEEIAMEIDTIEVGKAFTIDDILYATDSYELSSDAKFILDQFAKFLEENPTVEVTIQGHTDDVGNDATNKTLSANRARGAMEYIASRGISSNRLKSEGFGESKPKVPNTSTENRAKNRRTDFLITAY